jgi:DNA polymerase-3 subunit alpha/error-prone DNA polymerase
MIPLVVRSHFSLMWGTASVKALCRVARQRGYRTLALTDTNNLYGLWPFRRACAEEGLRPIVGAEITDPLDPRRRAVCLVENDEGYRHLCRLLTRRHLEPSFGLEMALIAEHQGLVVLTADPALLTSWHGAGVSVAAALPRRSGGPALEARRAAQRLGVLTVATPSSFFLEPADHHLHQLLRAIATRRTLARLAPGEVAPAEAWLASAEDYRQRFQLDPEALAASWSIAERCTFDGPRHGIVLPPWDDDQGRSADEILRAAAYEGARWRYGDDLCEAAIERLDYELEQIKAKRFATYFLVVQQIVQRSPRVCGRGSGAASLVAYCLGISNVCPLKHHLYFERFLNPGRSDPPDIDVDFAWDERDELLQGVLAHYRGQAAMVCNHVLFQPRMAIREVARVYGLTDGEIGRVLTHLSYAWSEEERGEEGAGQGAKAAVPPVPSGISRQLSSPWPEILELARRLVGIPRYLSVHPGGMIITPGPLAEYVPLEWAPKGVPIIQWEKDGAEEGGLVKIDLLGNRSLGVIRDALSNLRENGRPFDERFWEPEEDEATQQALARGATMGCFYIESPAMRLLQQRSGKGDFAHLVIHSSIIRPAANEYIREYLRRLKGGRWRPLHPLLEEVLQETYGIMVYQEDVSKTAVAVAGFSHAAADGLRKILSKKDREHQLQDYRRQFVQGARARGLTEAQIEEIWAMIMSFSGYSFCKPHSASYARVSYQAAYLKVHHPAEFMAAVISNEGGYYSPFAYVSEARRLGLTVLAPCVNESRRRWWGHNRHLRVGLQAIKGLGAATAERIVAERQIRGPYRTLEEFLERVRANEDEIHALIDAGAADALGQHAHRALLRWELLRYKRHQGHRREASGPADLFVTLVAPQRPPPPALPPGGELEGLRRQFAVLGFLCDRHPLELYRQDLARLGVIKGKELPHHVGRRVRCAGWLLTAKLVPTRKGEPMEFITFEDDTAVIETTFFPKTYRRYCRLLASHRPFLFGGRVEEDFAVVTLTVDSLQPLAPLSPGG